MASGDVARPPHFGLYRCVALNLSVDYKRTSTDLEMPGSIKKEMEPQEHLKTPREGRSRVICWPAAIELSSRSGQIKDGLSICDKLSVMMCLTVRTCWMGGEDVTLSGRSSIIFDTKKCPRDQREFKIMLQDKPGAGKAPLTARENVRSPAAGSRPGARRRFRSCICDRTFQYNTLVYNVKDQPSRSISRILTIYKHY
ncbi:hypothetical protein Bbelb_174810 [Branchiostoma belcheri]|nr:hypothetical protein Bbelb_174810 [Branchiostoma belcheri]